MSVAVIDLETTGLSPRVDRVVEVGVVLLDERGEMEGEFATLVNPGRDVGPIGVHGIRAADVVEAPTFAEIARHLRSLLAGRLVVAHNALFDDAPPSMAPYLTVLDQVLEDRLVSVSEADQLFALAGELNCSSEHVMTAHRLYLDALTTVAMADGVVADEERADLDRVAGLLGLAERDVDLALTLVRSGAQVTLPRSLSAFAPGDRIVFTGAMSRTRADLEEAARAAGLTPTASASGRTNVLVCADPHSQSGKAMKARSLGVRFISEAVFWEALSIAA